MSLKIQQREVDGILILEMEGRLVLGNNLMDVQETITGNINCGNLRQVLNLRQVSTIDSSGLGTLVLVHTSVESAGGALKLVHLSERHLELMVLTKLTGVFEIFNSEQDAINSFYPEREVKRFDILEFVRSQEDGEHGPEHSNEPTGNGNSSAS
ncbi:MAG TPA: STAS domain-containing protein [Bryobacteraceae bacterium]|nr:STAS domain-containing protein [Bryobacteraceae bacterium]